MTNDEFLQEALACPSCPEDFEKTYSHFCKYQSMAVSMLRDVARVCDKYGITYVLSSGSLLGAVRDKGQIPWDYDVDITVPYCEKEKLYKAFDEDLDDRYYFCCPERDKKYRPYIARVVPKGYMHQAVHIDIFFIVGLPGNPEECESYCREVREAVLARKYVAADLREYSYSLRTKLHYFFLKLRYLAKYGKKATADHSSLFNRYDIHTAPRVGYISPNCGKNKVNLDTPSRFLEPIKLETANGTFSIPADYEVYLTERYRDWKAYLPVEKRIAEVVKHHELFKWFESQGKAGGQYDD